MDHWLVGAGLAAVLGVLISAGNYLLSKRILEKKPSMLSVASVPRQIINVAYLLVVYLAAPLTPWGLTELLVGAAVGLTGAMFYFTGKLLKTAKPPEEAQSGGDKNG